MSKEIWNKLWRVLSFTLGLLIVIYFFKKNGGFDIFKKFLDLNMELGFLAFSLYAVSIFLATLQWKLLLKIQKIKASFFSLFKIFYLSLFFNSLIFSIAGEFSKAHKLKKVGIPLIDGFFSSLCDRYFGFLSLAVLCFISCFLGFFNIIHAPVLQVLNEFLWISSVILLVCILFFPVFFSNRIRLKLWNFFSKIVPGKWLYDKLYTLQKKIPQQEISNPIFSMGIILLTSLGVQSLRIMSFYVCIQSFSISINPLYLFCFLPIMSFFLIFPVNIAGWGLPQTIGIYLLSLPKVIVSPFPIEDSLIASAIVLSTIIAYGTNLLGGIFIFSKIKLK